MDDMSLLFINKLNYYCLLLLYLLVSIFIHCYLFVLFLFFLLFTCYYLSGITGYSMFPLLVPSINE